MEEKGITTGTGYVGPKRSLILAGGGIRLAYQAGVLQALEEGGLRFSHVDGTSGGIFNTGMLCSGLSPDQMAQRWRALKIRWFMSARPVKNYLKLPNMMGFGDADGIRDKVFPALGIDVEKIRNNRQFTATFNVCNFSHKTNEAITNDKVTLQHLLAGVSLPIFMPGIKIGGDWYTDAVWIKDANLMEAVRRGAEELWVVWAIGNGREYLPGFFNQYVHMIEMSANGALGEEFRQIRELNERITRGDSPYGQTAPIKLYVIKPHFPLPLDPDLFLGKITAGTLVDMGYADAKKYLANFSEDGVEPLPTATAMADPGQTIHFLQQYTGNITTGSDAFPLRLQLSITFRRQEGTFSGQAFGSLHSERFEKPLSTFNNHLQLLRDGPKQALQFKADVNWNGEHYSLAAEIPLHAFIDLVLGLEFKHLHLSLMRKGDASTPRAEGKLCQSVGSRVGFMGKGNVGNVYGWINKLKARYRLLSELYRP